MNWLKAAADIEKSCAHFRITPPDFSLLSQIRATMAEVKERSAAAADFVTKLNQILAQDWFAASQKLDNHLEMLSQWQSEARVKNDPSSSLIVST